MARLSAPLRRDAIVDATIAVARRKGLAGTTVRDVAAEMGSSSGLLHHYFETMDEVLAAAFERVAGEDLRIAIAEVRAAPDPVAGIAAIFRVYAPVDADWAFQMWLDAWAEAARRPALQSTSRRLNLEWQSLVEGVIQEGVEARRFACPDPAVAAWRILSLLDGLALQVVAHGSLISRTDVLAWASAFAERELGLEPGVLNSRAG